MKTFALLGNPNSGKTTLYNSLTGSTARVGNWSGVTVEKRSGSYKKLYEPIEIVDLPGIYSLSPYTSEEIISRNFILEENPDCVINIVDATSLERSLYLTTQALEIDVPLIVALNMTDEIKKLGQKIDVEKLEKTLGVPVVEISALKEYNLDLLMERAYNASLNKRKGRTVIENEKLLQLIGDVNIAYERLSVRYPLFHAIKLIEKDEVEIKEHSELMNNFTASQKRFNDEIFGCDFETLIADARYNYIEKYFSNVIIGKKLNDINISKGVVESSKSDRIDKVLTNKWAAIPIFLVILFLIFHFTFSANLFFLKPLFVNAAPSFEGSVFEGILWCDDGLASLGVFLQNLVIATTDLLTEFAISALSNAPSWLSGLLVDGVLGGLFAILSFLPQILLLFLFFSILEDSGYMARIAFILDKVFRKFGLSGRAFLPMIMGFGCSVPAMINTRTLGSESEKKATLRVIPFFSCGAKLPILVAISGGIVSYFGVGNADVIIYSMYVIGIVTAISCVILMRNTTMRGNNPPFIMELPTYRIPQFKSTMIHLWDKLKHFIEKAFTVILASTIVIWFLSSFKYNFTMCSEIIVNGEAIGYDISESILAGIGQILQPLFTPMGFGSQLSSVGWVFAVAAITGLIAKENVIATFGTLAASLIAIGSITGDASQILADEEGIAASVAIISATNITIPGLLAFISFNMTTIPCFSAVATAKAESVKGKFKWTLLFWIAASFTVGTIVYTIGSAFVYTWWLGVIAVILLLLITLIIGCIINSYNSKHPVIKDLK